MEENTAPAPVESRQPSAHDLEVLSRQLGRPVRDVVEIPARCVCGNPLVAATAPRLSNGTPFPTTFYLTHPVITSAVSRLEAAGLMNEMNDRLAEDESLAAAYRAAHEAYLRARAEIGGRSGIGDVPEIAGVWLPSISLRRSTSPSLFTPRVSASTISSEVSMMP